MAIKKCQQAVEQNPATIQPSQHVINNQLNLCYLG